MSREHAALQIGSELRIEDLGSSNGTRVRDRPLVPHAPVELFPDDVIDLGAVLLVVQYRHLSQRVRRLCEPAFFDVRVEEEEERAKATGGSLEIATLEIDGALGAHGVQRLLAAGLRREELLTMRAGGRYEALLLEPSREARAERLARMVDP